MTRRLIIECGVAETRAALMIDDKVWKIWFGPARGDEASDIFPRAGRTFVGKVTRVDNSLDAVFIHIGEKLDAFLPITTTNAPHCVEGATVSVEVKSPPRQKKGAVLRFVEPLGATGEPGRLPPFLDPAVEVVQEFRNQFDEVIIDDGDAKRSLAEYGVKNVLHDSHRVSPFASLEIDAQINAAFHSHVPLLGGGALTIDETQALTSIDVDTGALSSSSSDRLREKISLAAASEAVRQISLRSIGGHVVIDFPKIKGNAGRKRLQESLRKELSQLDKVNAASFSKSGLFTFVAPHRAPSLVERFTEESPCEPLAGRSFRLDFLARCAITKLESSLRASPSSQFKLSIGEGLDAYLKLHVQWGDRLRAKYGSRIEIKLNANCGERGYELSERR